MILIIGMYRLFDFEKNFLELTFSKKFSVVNWARNLRYSERSCSSCIFCCSVRNFETPPTLWDNLSSAIKSFFANLNGWPPVLPKSWEKLNYHLFNVIFKFLINCGIFHISCRYTHYFIAISNLFRKWLIGIFSLFWKNI